MRCLLFILFLSGVVVSASAQQLEPNTKAQRAEAYHLKSKRETTAATVLVATGGVMAITGTVLFYKGAIGDPPQGENTSLENTGGVLATAGVLCMAGSVPLFIMGARHRKHFKDLSLDYHWEPTQTTGLRGMNTMPAVGLKVKL
jgi:hypothetical protein